MNGRYAKCKYLNWAARCSVLSTAALCNNEKISLGMMIKHCTQAYFLAIYERPPDGVLLNSKCPLGGGH